MPPPFEFLSRRKVKRNYQLKIVKLKKTRQFSSLMSLEHQYLKQSEALITQICFL